MLIQPESILLADVEDVTINGTYKDGQVLLPSGMVVDFETEQGTFSFRSEGRKLVPYVEVDVGLATRLTKAVQQVPGSGSARYDMVTWTASSHLKDADRDVMRTDEFDVNDCLSAFAVGVPEASLGTIQVMVIRIP